MGQPPISEPFWTRHAAIVIAGGYCLISLIYIYTSDYLVFRVSQDLVDSRRFQMIKGSAFVVITSLLLFAVMQIAFSLVRRAKQAELTASEQYRTIIETTSEGVWLVDGTGTTVFVNDHMARMLGRNRSELIGLPQTELLGEKWADMLAEQFEQQRCGNHNQTECQLDRPDGKTMWVTISASPIFDPDGEFTGCIRMVTDINQLKATEEALKASLQSQRQLLNELDHRVRNNLSSLVSLVDISRSSARDVMAFAESIRGRIDAMNHAYGLLSSSGWKRQDFHRLLQTLIPGRYSKRVEMAGPHIEFAPYLSGAVAIVIHELVTNAIQHGSLSNDTGRIGITWRVLDASDRSVDIELRWTEGGGPEVPETIAAGTGISLIQGLTESDLRGEVSLSYPPEGARHILRMRLDDSKLEGFGETADEVRPNGRAEPARSAQP
jgi:PAS domain S-box-containing protein